MPKICFVPVYQETYAGGTPTDSDLFEIANSVPGLIGQTFAVNSVNDLCVWNSISTLRETLCRSTMCLRRKSTET